MQKNDIDHDYLVGQQPSPFFQGLFLVAIAVANQPCSHRRILIDGRNEAEAQSSAFDSNIPSTRFRFCRSMSKN